MKISILRSQFHLLGTNLRTPIPNSPILTQKPIKSHPKHPTNSPPKPPTLKPAIPTCQTLPNRDFPKLPPDGHSRSMILGAATVGFALVVMGMGANGEHNKALAFVPEGPMVEEFWDNVRRYAIYALTVSTGALYTIFVPIVELLKNPITAVLILVILGGSFYVVSQVLYAMVGVSDFSYDYGY